MSKQDSRFRSGSRVSEREKEREKKEEKSEEVTTEEESTSTASEVRAVDTYDVTSGVKLTEVETGKMLPGNEPETTSVQTEKDLESVDEDKGSSKKTRGKSKRDIISITGKYTRTQPMTSIRRIEAFDVADDEGGTNKKRLSYEQVVANIEEGQIYSIVDSNGDSSRLKVVNTPRGKVITTEKDNSEVNNITGTHLAEYPLDADTQAAMEAEEAQVKSKKEKEKESKK